MPTAASDPLPIARRHCVQLDGHPFRYFSWGERGPAVVLVHATGFHAYVWKPIAIGLAAHCRVFAFDQRGHGDSWKPATGYAWEVFGDDLFRFLAALELQPVAAVGHSAGATAIALCAAAHPGSIARAVLIDPVLFPRMVGGRPVIDNPLAHRARKRRMLWENCTALFHSYRLRPPFNTWREDVLWAYIEEGTTLLPDGRVELKCPGTIEAQIYEMAPSLDGFAVLPRVRAPVLLIRGERSDSLPAENAERALALLPEARSQTLAGTTHFVPMEQPDAVEALVGAFFGIEHAGAR